MTTIPSTQAVLPENTLATQTSVKAKVHKPVSHSASDAKEPRKPVKASAKKTSAHDGIATKSDAKQDTKRTVKASVKHAPDESVKSSAKSVKVTRASKAVVELPKHGKLTKAKKPKLVRDSFTMPKPEYLVLDELKLRAAMLASPIKKTELIRAGIKALAAMSDTAFLAAIKAVPVIKTGRPALS